MEEFASYLVAYPTYNSFSNSISNQSTFRMFHLSNFFLESSTMNPYGIPYNNELDDSFLIVQTEDLF